MKRFATTRRDRITLFSLPRRLPAWLLATGLLIALPLAAQQPDLEILYVVEEQNSGDDIVADLRWNENPGTPVYLVARELDGSLISSTLIAVGGSSHGNAEKPNAKPGEEQAAAKAVEMHIRQSLPAVLGDIGTTGIHVRLAVEDASGAVFSNLYPFVIEWVPGPGGCEGKVFGRTETNAVIVGFELDQLLDTAVYDRLDDHLDDLLLQSGLDPVVKCQATAMQTELARLDSLVSGTDPCGSFWQAVVVGERLENKFYFGDFPNGRSGGNQSPTGFVEMRGYERTASHCVDALAVGDATQSELEFETNRVTDDSLTTELSTRRWFGPEATCGCSGAVTQTARLSGLINLQAVNLGDGQAVAWAGEEFFYTVGEEQLVHERQFALVQTGSLPEDSESISFGRSLAVVPSNEPLTSSLRATGGALVTASDHAYARADYRSDYTWQQDANASCAVISEVYLILQPPVIFAGNDQLKLEPYP